MQVFAQLLRAPRDDADAIIKERFPVPRLVICDQHGSQVINFIRIIYACYSKLSNTILLTLIVKDVNCHFSFHFLKI